MSKAQHEDLVLTEENPIKDPAQLKRLLKAAEVLQLQVEHNISITAACKQVGISRATYSRWVKDGIFAQLVEAYVAPIQLELQTNALQGMGAFVTWLIETASGDTEGATNFDRMNAGKMLWTEFAGPFLKQMAPVAEEKPEEEEDEGAEYLKTDPEWKKLGPGEKVTKTTTVERSDAPIDVTPPGEGEAEI